MKRLLFFFSVFLIVGNILFSEVPVVEVQTESLFEFGNNQPHEPHYQFGDYVFINGQTTLRLDLRNGEVYEYDRTKEIYNILGRINDGFLVNRLLEHRNMHLMKTYVYIYKPDANEYVDMPGIEEYFFPHRIASLFHYYDNFLLGTKYTGTSDNTIPLLFNSVNGEHNRIPESVVIDVSDDKLLSIRENYKECVIYSNEIEKKIGIIEDINRAYKNIFFIGNNLIAQQILDKMFVYNFDGELIVIFHYNHPLEISTDDWRFKKVQNSQYGFFGQRVKIGSVLVVMPDERDYLRENGYLFTPTTGRCNDTRVRVREWPLLEAQHLAFLEEGDELEILDRSGIKVEIGDMEDYWYKIRRVSDGLEGWSYGAFIELDESE